MNFFSKKNPYSFKEVMVCFKPEQLKLFNDFCAMHGFKKAPLIRVLIFNFIKSYPSSGVIAVSSPGGHDGAGENDGHQARDIC
jgi:hypothetical protein